MNETKKTYSTAELFGPTQPPIQGQSFSTDELFGVEKKPSFLKRAGAEIVDQLGGIGEAAATIGSAAVGFPASVITGIGTAARDLAAGNFDPSKVDVQSAREEQEKVANALIYQPKTRFGQTTVEVFGSLFALAQKGITAGAKQITKDPQAQAAIAMAGDAALAFLVPKLAKITRNTGKMVSRAIYEDSINQVRSKGLATGHSPEVVDFVVDKIREQVTPGSILEETKRNIGVRKGEVKEAVPKLQEAAIPTQPTAPKAPVESPTSRALWKSFEDSVLQEQKIGRPLTETEGLAIYENALRSEGIDPANITKGQPPIQPIPETSGTVSPRQPVEAPELPAEATIAATEPKTKPSGYTPTGKVEPFDMTIGEYVVRLGYPAKDVRVISRNPSIIRNYQSVVAKARSRGQEVSERSLQSLSDVETKQTKPLFNRQTAGVDELTGLAKWEYEETMGIPHANEITLEAKNRAAFKKMGIKRSPKEKVALQVAKGALADIESGKYRLEDLTPAEKEALYGRFSKEEVSSASKKGGPIYETRTKAEELLNKTGKPSAEIEEFKANTFMDGEAAKEIAQSVLRGTMSEEQAVAELSQMVADTVGTQPEAVEIVPPGEAYNIAEEQAATEALTKKLATPKKTREITPIEKPVSSALSDAQKTQVSDAVLSIPIDKWRGVDAAQREASRQETFLWVSEHYKPKPIEVKADSLDPINLKHLINSVKGNFEAGKLKTRAEREVAVLERPMPTAETKEGPITIEPSAEASAFTEAKTEAELEASESKWEKGDKVADAFHGSLVKRGKAKEAEVFSLIYKDRLNKQDILSRVKIAPNTYDAWLEKWTKEMASDPSIQKIRDKQISELTGDEFNKISESFAADLEKDIGKTEPPVGLSVKFTKQPPAKPTGPQFKFEGETEARYQKAKKLPTPTPKERVAGFIEDVKNGVTRTYEHLPRGPRFVKATVTLKNLEKQPSITSDRAVRTLRSITYKLTPEEYDLATRKAILDDLVREADLGHDLPFGFTLESVRSELSKLDSFIADKPNVKGVIDKRSKLWKALVDDYIMYREKVGHDVSGMLTNPNYFRHKVIEHAKEIRAGQGKRFRTQTGQEFLKKRVGSEKDILADFIQADYEVMHRMLFDIEAAKAQLKIDKDYNEWDKLAKEAKDKGVPIEEVIPEGYTKFQPKEGHFFYMADTLPVKIAEQIMNEQLDDIGVIKDKLRKSLAVGRKRDTWIIPTELADTLENLSRTKGTGLLGEGFKKINSAWKAWTLLSPRRSPKYNARNLTGDADHIFVGNPSAFKKFPKATRELWEIYFGDKPITGELAEYQNRGGLQTTLQVQEIVELKQSPVFKNVYRQSRLDNINIFKKYWRGVNKFTNFRESIGRYAAYLDYLEQMKANPEGRPKNFGFSIPEEIMALDDIKDRAFRLSNELLGAYDEISVYGQTIREKLFPFWSWKELNTKSYYRAVKNATRNDDAAMTLGKKVVGGARMSTATALKVGRFAMKALGLTALLTAWNNIVQKENEDDLPESVKTRLHITLGRDKDGNVIAFTRLGAFGDFLEWFGLDGAQNHISDYLNGKKTLKEIGLEMAKSPVNIIVGGVSPFIKAPIEALTRRSLFPDAFNPRTVRDRGIYFANQLALEPEYRAIMGKPGKPYLSTMDEFAIYKYNPFETAYHEMRDLKNKYLKSQGKLSEGFFLSPSSDALYNMKLAHRYGDHKAVQKYLEKYTEIIYMRHRGEPESKIREYIKRGIKASFSALHPLSGVAKKDRSAFVNTLTENEKDQLVKAMRFYNDVLIGGAEFAEGEANE